MKYQINNQKLEQVVSEFQAHPQGDAGATSYDIESHICSDWPEGQEHQDWIDESNPDEIVDWLVSTWF